MTTPLSTPPRAPRLHPAADGLDAYVAGQLPLCRRVMVEAHLALCAECRDGVAERQRPGGEWLRSLPDAPAPDRLWQGLLSRLEPRPSADAPDDPYAGVPLPTAARLELPPRTEPLAWQPMPGSPARLSALAVDPAHELQLLLVVTPPEGRFPWHRHLGGEELLILTGGLSDRYGHYLPGDFALYGPGTEHEPRMDPGEPCWALACVLGGVDFER